MMNKVRGEKLNKHIPLEHSSRAAYAYYRQEHAQGFQVSCQ